MKTVVEEIDVKKAKAFLLNNIPFESGSPGTNRPILSAVVNNYARDMLNGHWWLTHQGLGFDTNGKLKDGQHRLLALVMAAEDGATDGEHVVPPNPKIKLQFNVTYGLEPDVFDVLDVGRIRSSNQILAMAGHVNTMKLAAAGRLLYLYDHYEYEQWRRIKVPTHTILAYVNETKLQNYVDVGTSLQYIGVIATAATVGFYVCERVLPDAPHQSFLEGLRTGENLGKENPVNTLRNYFIRSKKDASSPRRESFYHLALYIKAWNDFCNKRRRSTISWKPSESFPRPIEKVNGD